MSDRNYKDIDGNSVSIHKLCRDEPEWAASRIATVVRERDEAVELLREVLFRVQLSPRDSVADKKIRAFLAKVKP